MKLKEYYISVCKDIESKKFKILKINSQPNEKISPHLEALNYIIFEYNEDYKNYEMNNIFDYIIKTETDFDFTTISFDEFFKFIRTIKTDENILVDIKDITIEQYTIPTIVVKETEIDFWTEPLKIKKVKPIRKFEATKSIDDFWK